jgi:hypothetical protein
MRSHYYSRGFVYGVFWGGEKGAYPASVIRSETRDGLLVKAREKLVDGSLDLGITEVSIIEYQ